jgi:hypothetical protein
MPRRARKPVTPPSAIGFDIYPIHSSVIAALGYDDATQTLGVRFNSGTEYLYFDVPEELFVEIATAKSVGQVFDEKVRNADFAFQRVR